VKKSEFVEKFGEAVAALDLVHSPFGIGTKNDVYFRLIDGLVLILVLEIVSGKVTASYWLGATFAWGNVPEGVSKHVFRRVPVLLTPEDRLEILGPEDPSQGGDSWWVGLTPETLSALSEAVRRAEPHFLARAPKDELRACAYSAERRSLIELVGAGVTGPRPTLEELRREGALLPWLASAELVSKTDLRVPRARGAINVLAEDAALCHALGLVETWREGHVSNAP
jgi:hypothetical protein